MAGAGFTITEHDPKAFTREELGLELEIHNEISHEMLPGDPDVPMESYWAAHEATPARLRRFSYRAWADDDTLIGMTASQVDTEHDDNPDVLRCVVSVRAPFRRRGAGSTLLAHMVARARLEGRTRLIGWTSGGVAAGAEFARVMGGVAGSDMHLNHLPIAEVDRSMMEAWVAEGPARAAHYELLAWDGPIPDEYLADFVDLVHVMNDAPRDDIQLNDWTMTPAELREYEDQALAVGSEQWTLVARRRSDGTFAGFHDVHWAPHEPHTVYVGNTGVRPEHRGHALGKWLKAAMTLRVMDERPDVTAIRTGNADSNDAMLGINHAMGYRPLVAETVWDLNVETAAESLEARGIEIPTLSLR